MKLNLNWALHTVNWLLSALIIKFKHWKRAKQKVKFAIIQPRESTPNWIWLKQYKPAPLAQWAHNSRPRVNRPTCRISTLAFTSKTWRATYTRLSCRTFWTTTWGAQMTRPQWLAHYWGVSMEAKSTSRRAFLALSPWTRMAVSSPTLSSLSECSNFIAKLTQRKA